MGFSDDIKPYTDSFGLIAPHKLAPGTIRGSDNGPLFTAQYLLLGGTDAAQYCAILNCIDNNHVLHRAPGDITTDAPDDHYGALAAGFMNVSLAPHLWQPALLYLLALNLNLFPARIFSPLIGLIIALSNIGESYSDTGNKLLTWTLIKGTQNRSWFCKLGGWIWTKRMQSLYGSTKAIAEIYYEAGHPFIANWKE
jgi:hypothetical protein